MYSIIFLVITAFILSLITTPIVRAVARRLGILDKPDLDRKIHSEPVARIGGIAVAISYALAFCIFLLTPMAGSAIVRENTNFIWSITPAAILILIAGAVDDIIGLAPLQKLAAQLIAATLAFAMGVRVLAAGEPSGMVWWSLPLTVLWLVFTTNAFNLIDGLDGLAAGLGLFAAITALLSAIVNENIPLALATAPLAGCLLGFLRYNFHPASIFLGDSGSLLIGFLLGCYGVIWSHKSATLLGMAAPLMAIAIPLLDTTLAVLRRFLRHRPIFVADRGHLHHLLLDRGLTPRRAALLLYGVAVIGAMFALIQDSVRHIHPLPVLFTFVGTSLVGIYLLRVAEIDVASQMLFTGSFRRIFDAHLALRQFEISLLSARTMHECWQIIEAGAKERGFCRIRLNVGGQIWEEAFSDLQNCNQRFWRASLTGPDYIELHHNATHTDPDLIGPFVDIVCRQLAMKHVLFEHHGAALAAHG